MSRPWMPLYVADYLSDTRDLTTLHHGAYMLLIMEYWQRGGLPTDEASLARLAGLDAKDWKKVRPRLASLFGDGWRHKRIDAELAKATEKYERRANAGKIGGNAKANNVAKSRQSSSNATSIALANGYQPQPQPQPHNKLPAAQPTTPAPEPVAAAPPDRFAEIEHACRKALGSASPADPVIGPMLAVCDEIGQDRAMMILAAEARRPRTKPIRTWRIWAEIVRENASDYRALPTSPAAPKVPMIDLRFTTAPEQTVRNALAAWREQGRRSQWPEGTLGPPPDAPTCWVPNALLAEYGFVRPPYPDDEDAA